ncbi:NAD(P)-dependent oxidoreductase [Gordonia paraffinivorans]|uniref:NAD(P)-dependent oxidoreductase n=1 Tax=Gordonia paraffinivorans TaxID=175628 RepID=UPI003FCE820E
MTDAPPTARPRLGFVGLGNIGGPMAGSLAAWPGGLSVFDLSADAVAKVAQKGADAADSLAGLAEKSDIIGICVLDDEQVRSVVTGPDGLLSAARPQAIITVHSTIGADTAVELAEQCAARDVILLDAPISGGAMGAASGRLAIMVGGPREAYQRLKEPFSLVADMIVHAGDVGAGTKMKLARNLLHFISFAATTEAARLAEAAGLDIAELGKVVRHSDAVTGGPGAIMLRDTTAPVDTDDPWYGILTGVRTLGEKDLSLALALADELDVDLPLGRIALRDLAAGLGVPHAKGDNT